MCEAGARRQLACGHTNFLSNTPVSARSGRKFVCDIVDEDERPSGLSADRRRLIALGLQYSIGIATAKSQDRWMSRLQRMLFALAAIFALSGGLRARALSPEDIYLRAQEAVNALPQPDYVAFTLQDHTQKQHSLDQERLRILVRSSDGHAFVVPLQDAGGNTPHEQPGVATNSFERWTALYRIGDFPLADFGLRKRGSGRPGIFEASGTPQPEPADMSGTRVIASVRVVNIPYRIVDLGDTTIDGYPVYHLGLQPRYDAGHHVLREMWIDKASLLPRRYVAERFVGGLISFRYLVTVNTATIDGHLVNIDADGHFNVNRALLIHYTGEGRWTVSDVSFPAAPPSWLFDPGAFSAHKSEAIPAF
jgi:hypothetical protein